MTYQIKFTLILFLTVILFSSCSTSQNYLRLGDDIDDIHQQLYDLKKEQLQNAIRIEELQNKLSNAEQPLPQSSGVKNLSAETVNVRQEDVQSVLSAKIEVHTEDVPVVNNSRNSSDIYNKGYELFNRSEFEEAISVFSQYAAGNPDTHLADNAYYWIGECRYSLKLYKDAVKAFDHVIQNYPKGNKVAASHLKKGLCYLKMEMPQIALSTFQNIKEKYPGTESARIAESKIRELQKR